MPEVGGEGGTRNGSRRGGTAEASVAYLPFAKDQSWMKVSHSFDQNPSVSAMWKGQSWGESEPKSDTGTQDLKNVLLL